MSSSASLPSPDDDYAAPLDAFLNKAFWDAALKSVGARIRALEAVKADWEELINTGTGQALAVIKANVEPQLVALNTVINQLKAEVAAAEDAIAVIIAGGVNMSNVIGLEAALSAKASLSGLDDAVAALAHLMENYVSYTEAQELTSEQKALALSNLGLDDIHNTLTPITIVAAAGQIDFALGTEVSPGACLVFHNGAKLSGIDYALTTTTLSLVSAAVAGDVVTVIAIGTFEVANALLPAANLADLADIVAAQNNLGLKSAATKAAGDPSLMPSGSVIGRAYAEYTATTVYTNSIPTDASIPQITEGVEILSLSYTPKVVGSKLRITFGGLAQVATTGQPLAAATFLNGGHDAVDTTLDYHYYDGDAHRIATCFEIAPSGLVPQTIAVRVGTSSGGAFKFNGQGGGTFGGTMKTTLIVEEIAP